MTNILDELTACEVFRSLTSDQVERLAMACRSKSFGEKCLMSLPSSVSRSVFLLAKGRARIYHLNADGRQTVLSFIEPREVFGELAIIDLAEQMDYVEAMAASVVIQIPVGEVQQFMKVSPAFSMDIARLIGVRRRRIERRLKNLLFRSNREKLVHLLLELVEQYGSQNGIGVELGIPLSHQELANVIGSTRETVTITLGHLRDEGLIHLARQRIVLKRMDRLAVIVGRDQPRLPVPA